MLGLATGWATSGIADASDRFAKEALALAQRHEFHELAYWAESLLQKITVPDDTQDNLEVPASNEIYLADSTRNGLARLLTVHS